MDNNIDPKVGEVWLVDLSNATGHQQRGIRPFVVTSNNKRNFFSPTIKGNPLSSRIYKRSPVHVLLSKEDCDFLEVDSIVLCEETDTLNKGQFIKKLGVLSERQMSMAKQDNYKKERTETALSFHFSDFGMRGYISMVKPSGLFLRFSFSFW